MAVQRPIIPPPTTVNFMGTSDPIWRDSTGARPGAAWAMTRVPRPGGGARPCGAMVPSGTIGPGSIRTGHRRLPMGPATATLSDGVGGEGTFMEFVEYEVDNGVAVITL